MSVLIQIDQDRPTGLSAGTAGIARNDLWLNKQVTAHVPNTNTHIQWVLDVPPGSSATLDALTADTTHYTPDVLGSYRLGVTCDLGRQTLSSRCFTDANGDVVNEGLVLPSYKELDGEANYSGNASGWAEILEKWFDLFVARLLGVWTSRVKLKTTDGSQQPVATILLPDNTAADIEVTFTGQRTGGSAAGSVGDCNKYVRRVLLKRISGVTSQVGTTDTIGADKRDDTNWGGPALVVDATLGLKPSVTGLANANVTWFVTVVRKAWGS